MKWKNIDRAGHAIDGKLWFGEPYEDDRRAISVCVPKKTGLGLAVEVTLGGQERDIMLRLKVPYAEVFVSAEGLISWATRHAIHARVKARIDRLNALDRAKPRSERYGTRSEWSLDPFSTSRVTGFYLTGDGFFHASLFSNGDWSDRDRRELPWNGNGWAYSADLKDAILGKPTYEEGDVYYEGVHWCMMPEGKYPVHLQIRKGRLLRSRLPASKWSYRSEITVLGGCIPFPGKGENSHDCGDSGIYSISCSLDEEPMSECVPIMALSLDVLKNRQRYGSLSYKPRDGWPKNCYPSDLDVKTMSMEMFEPAPGWVLSNKRRTPTWVRPGTVFSVVLSEDGRFAHLYGMNTMIIAYPSVVDAIRAAEKQIPAKADPSPLMQAT